MKKILYLYSILLFSVHGLAQEQVVTKYVLHEVIYFEGITQIGERLIGIAPDRSIAQKVIADYTKRNQKTKHKLTYKKIIATTIIAAQRANVYQDFLKHCPKGYRLFSMLNYNSLSIAKNDTKEAAVWYYLKTKNTTPTIAKSKINELVEKYASYIIP